MHSSFTLFYTQPFLLTEIASSQDFNFKILCFTEKNFILLDII